MNPRRKKRLVALSGGLIGLGAIVALVLVAFSSNINLFYTPSDIINGHHETGQKPTVGESLRVGGLVVPGSVSRNEETLDVVFELIDQGPKVMIEYQGMLPDLFREGQGIIADGVLVAPNRIRASEVLAKHDENYMPKEIAESLEKYDPERMKDYQSRK